MQAKASALGLSMFQEMMVADQQSKEELMLKQLQKELRWIQKQLSLIANGSNGPVRTNEKAKWIDTPNTYRIQETV